MALAVRELKNKGATFITVHGNDPILRAAVQEQGSAQILAVTVLTSFDESDMREMGMTGTIEDLVYHRPGKRSPWAAMAWFPPAGSPPACGTGWATSF